MGSISLIRHGQASWGAADYDALSDLGRTQSGWLGLAWEAGDVRPTGSVAGSMTRHAQTAVATLDAIDGDLYDVDARWNEYDHLQLVGMHDVAARPDDPAEFQAVLDGALERWVGGDAGALGETFAEFSDRVLGAFHAARAEAGSGRHVAVFTSGGPIALVASHLLAGDASLFITLNRVVVNASVSTVIVGARGARLLTFNEHGHLPRAGVTFR